MKMKYKNPGGSYSGMYGRVNVKGGSLQKLSSKRQPGNNLNNKLRRRY
jgi:hypothetical protein